MNKEQEQIIDEAYLNYSKNHFKIWEPGIEYDSKESFINKIKTYAKFSEKWGLKIEERKLSLEERCNLMPHIAGHSQENIDMRKKINNFEGNIPGISYHEEWLNSFKIPTKLITITYQNETVITYE